MKTSTRNWIFGGLAAIVICLSLFSWLSNRHLRKEKERTSYYYSLFKDMESKKDSLQSHSDSVEVVLARYQYLIDSLETAVVGLNEQTVYLNAELEKALKEIDDLTYDENYDWLQSRYPTEDTLEYPFAGEQVKQMTKELLTFDYTDSLYQAQIDVSILQEAQLGYKDEIIKTLKEERDDLQKLATRLYDQLAIKVNENQLKDEEIAKLRKALNMWRIGAITGGAFVVLVLLLV